MNKRKEANNETGEQSRFKRKCLDKIFLVPNENEEKIYLDDESWIVMKTIEPPNGLTMDEFEDLWKLKPQRKLQIKIAGKVIDCPRYSKSYLKAYWFTGLDHKADMDIPKRIEELLEHSKETSPFLNQALVNWYPEDGSIGKHSDDTKQLRANSDIYSYSFGPAIRSFVLEPKDKMNGKRYFVELKHNTLVVMGGKCQDRWLHSVPKGKDNKCRLNVTFRCFV